MTHTILKKKCCCDTGCALEGNVCSFMGTDLTPGSVCNVFDGVDSRIDDKRFCMIHRGGCDWSSSQNIIDDGGGVGIRLTVSLERLSNTSARLHAVTSQGTTLFDETNSSLTSQQQFDGVVMDDSAGGTGTLNECCKRVVIAGDDCFLITSRVDYSIQRCRFFGIETYTGTADYDRVDFSVGGTSNNGPYYVQWIDTSPAAGLARIMYRPVERQWRLQLVFGNIAADSLWFSGDATGGNHSNAVACGFGTLYYSASVTDNTGEDCTAC